MGACLTLCSLPPNVLALLKGGESLGPPAEAHAPVAVKPVADTEFSVGPKWPLQLPGDSAVRRNGGLSAHPAWA